MSAILFFLFSSPFSFHVIDTRQKHFPHVDQLSLLARKHVNKSRRIKCGKLFEVRSKLFFFFFLSLRREL